MKHLSGVLKVELRGRLTPCARIPGRPLMDKHRRRQGDNLETLSASSCRQPGLEHCVPHPPLPIRRRVGPGPKHGFWRKGWQAVHQQEAGKGERAAHIHRAEGFGVDHFHYVHSS